MTGAFGTGPTNHDEYEELAAGWLLNTLGPGDRDRFALHVRGCEACRRALVEYQSQDARPLPRAAHRANAGRYGDASPRQPQPQPRPNVPAPTAPPSRARSRADARGLNEAAPAASASPRVHTPEAGQARHRATRTSQKDVRTATRRPAPSRPRLPLRLVAVAAVLVALLGGNVWQYQQRRAVEDRADQQALTLRDAAARQQNATQRSAALVRLLARPEVQSTALAGPDRANRAFVLVDGTTVQVLTDGLTANDAAKSTYVLWQLADNNAMRSIGTFDVANQNVGLFDVGELPADGAVVSRFALSLELGRTPPERPGNVLAEGDVGR